MEIAGQNPLENLIIPDNSKVIYFGEKFCVKKFFMNKDKMKDFARKVKERDKEPVLVIPCRVRQRELQNIIEVIESMSDSVDSIVCSDYGLCYYLKDKYKIIFEGRVFNDTAINSLSTNLNIRKIRITPPYLNLIKSLNRENVSIEIYSHGLIPISGSVKCLISSLYGCRYCGQTFTLDNKYAKIYLSGKTLRCYQDISAHNFLKQIEDFGIKSLVIDSFSKTREQMEKIIYAFQNNIKQDIGDYSNGVFKGDHTFLSNSNIWQKHYPDLKL